MSALPSDRLIKGGSFNL